MGRQEEPEDLFRRIVALGPYHHDALNNLGVVLARTNRPGEAMTVLRTEIRDADTSAEPLSNLACAENAERACRSQYDGFEIVDREFRSGFGKICALSFVTP